MKEAYKKSIKTIFKELNTNNLGLTEQEVIKRREKHGKNVLPKFKKKSPFMIFLSQFANSIIYLLIFACAFSFIIGDITEGIAIMFIILIDAFVGTIQEIKAFKSAESLQNLIKVNVKVIRDGKNLRIEAEDLVNGDIVIVESGDKVSADIRLINVINLTVNESILTGESIPVVKNTEYIKEKNNNTSKSNMLYSGTTILTGRGLGVVVGTALETEIGSIAETVIEEKEGVSPLTERMNKFSKQIVWIIIAIAVILTIIMVIKGFELEEVVLSIIALSVSAMPEGLPLAVTLVLTIASNKMAKKNVIIKKLNAAESLGSTTLIATDKTGTITVNEQTAKKILVPSGNLFNISGIGYNADGEIEYLNEELLNIIKFGVLNNESSFYKEGEKWSYFGDSIDIAFLVLGEKSKIKLSKSKTIERIPYESEKKYSAVLFEENKKSFSTIKGSPEVIIEFCNRMNDNGKIVKLNKAKVLKQNEKLAAEGYRVIALCYKETHDKALENFIFCGLVGFIDPVRKEVKPAIKECKDAGIKVVMITGDHALTAYSIAKEIEIAISFSEVTTGDELYKYYKKGEKEFDNFIKGKSVFTRTSPSQKLQIVESFKRMGEYVAVTGDGINDAPSIKVANIGCSMGNGTDVTKETSTIIITDNSFSSVVTGIKEGRVTYSNIRKVAYMLLSCGLAEVLFFAFAILCNLPIPLVTIQLLWLNLVTDGLQDMALAFEGEEKGIMKEKPRKPNESLLDKKLMHQILLAGVSIGLIVFSFWIYAIKTLNMDVSLARTYVVILMVFLQNFHVLNCRSERESIFKMSFLKNPYIILSITLSLMLQLIVIAVPTFRTYLKLEVLDFAHILIPIGMSISILVIMELYKLIKRIRIKRETI